MLNWLYVSSELAIPSEPCCFWGRVGGGVDQNSPKRDFGDFQKHLPSTEAAVAAPCAGNFTSNITPQG